jgi:hypothetical protein
MVSGAAIQGDLGVGVYGAAGGVLTTLNLSTGAVVSSVALAGCAPPITWSVLNAYPAFSWPPVLAQGGGAAFAAGGQDGNTWAVTSIPGIPMTASPLPPPPLPSPTAPPAGGGGGSRSGALPASPGAIAGVVCAVVAAIALGAAVFVYRRPLSATITRLRLASQRRKSAAGQGIERGFASGVPLDVSFLPYDALDTPSPGNSAQ